MNILLLIGYQNSHNKSLKYLIRFSYYSAFESERTTELLENYIMRLLTLLTFGLVLVVTSSACLYLFRF